MNIQRVLTTALLGVGLGALTLPGVALANVGAHPSVAPVGTTITLTARCKQQAKGPAPSATFHITGPTKERGAGADKDYGNAGSEKDYGNAGSESGRGGTGPDKERGGTGPDTGRGGTGSDKERGGTGSDKEYGAGQQSDKEYGGQQKDISVQSTGAEPKMPETVSAQVPTHDWKPGEYHVTAKCNDGTVAGATTFTLTPHGGPRSGEGAASGNGTLVAAGTAMLGAGAAGFVLLRRRRFGTTAA